MQRHPESRRGRGLGARESGLGSKESEGGDGTT